MKVPKKDLTESELIIRAEIRNRVVLRQLPPGVNKMLDALPAESLQKVIGTTEAFDDIDKKIPYKLFRT